MHVDLELVRVSKLDDAELHGFARQTYDIVSQPEVQRHLEMLHLPGVILRHSVSVEQSYAHFQSSQKAMGSGINQTYLAVTSGSNELAATISVDPKLKLYSQPLPLPAGLARDFGPPVSFPMDMSLLGKNMGMWGNPLHADHIGRLASAGIHLTSGPAEWDHLWSLLPRQAVKRMPGIAVALNKAGFYTDKSRFYDDQEDNRHLVPLSKLYVRQPPTKVLR